MASSAPASLPFDEDVIAGNVAGLAIRLGISSLVGFAGVLLFQSLRRRTSRLVQPNAVLGASAASQHRLALCFPEKPLPDALPRIPIGGWRDWLAAMDDISDAQVRASAGMDAQLLVLAFSTVLGVLRVVALAAVLMLAVTVTGCKMTGHGTAQCMNVFPVRSVPLEMVLNESPLAAWGTVALMTATAAYALHRFHRFWHHYVRLRQAYFRSADACTAHDARCLLVTHLPPTLVHDTYALTSVLRAAHVHHFTAADLARTVPTLTDTLARRAAALDQLERAVLDPDAPSMQVQLLCEQIAAWDQDIAAERQYATGAAGGARALHAAWIEFADPEDMHEAHAALGGGMHDPLQVHRAPKPEDVLWDALDRDPKKVRRDTVRSVALGAAGYLVWLAPCFLASAVAHPDALARQWGWWGTVVKDAPVFAGVVVAGMPTLWIAAFVALVVTKWAETVATWRGAHAKTVRARYYFTALATFALVGFVGAFTIMTGIWSSMSGSPLGNVHLAPLKGDDADAAWFKWLRDQTRDGAAWVLQAFVVNGAYYTYLAITVAGLLPLVDLARVGPVVRLMVGNNGRRTPRAALDILRPGWFPWPTRAALLVFWFFVSAAYAWSHPLVAVVAVALITILDSTTKWQVLYVLPKSIDSHGEYVPALYGYLLVCTILAQLLCAMYLQTVAHVRGPAAVMMFSALVSAIVAHISYSKYLSAAKYFREGFGPWDPNALRRLAQARRRSEAANDLDRVWWTEGVAAPLPCPYVEDPHAEAVLAGYFEELAPVVSAEHQRTAARRRTRGSRDLEDGFGMEGPPAPPTSPVPPEEQTQGKGAWHEKVPLAAAASLPVVPSTKAAVAAAEPTEYDTLAGDPDLPQYDLGAPPPEIDTPLMHPTESVAPDGTVVIELGAAALSLPRNLHRGSTVSAASSNDYYSSASASSSTASSLARHPPNARRSVGAPRRASTLDRSSTASPVPARAPVLERTVSAPVMERTPTARPASTPPAPASPRTTQLDDADMADLAQWSMPPARATPSPVPTRTTPGARRASATPSSSSSSSGGTSPSSPLARRPTTTRGGHARRSMPPIGETNAEPASPPARTARVSRSPSAVSRSGRRPISRR
ncbi:hypothetical protein GGF32_009836 [Allomyces javanicus]|nr:hypothetical protein GGF32_009836 [Allomyces javanicus]